MRLRGMLVAIVTAVFFLGWQVLPLVYGEREKKILPSLSSPSPPFSHSSFPGLLPSKQAALEPENGRRRTRNEWTDERTGQQRGRRRRARRHFDSLPPPPLPFPDLVKFSLLSDEGGRGGSCLLLSSAGMSRKRHSFPLLAWPPPPPLDPARLLTASPSEHLCLKAKVEEAAIWRLGGGRTGKKNKIGRGG